MKSDLNSVDDFYKVENWNPMRTAPRDGRYVYLALLDSGGRITGLRKMKWDSEREIWVQNDPDNPTIFIVWVEDGEDGQPTHWR